MAITIPNQSRTPEEAHAFFVSHGICISDWCRENGFSRYTVVDLLRDRRKGLRGEAHRAAVALGLKPDPSAKQ